MKAGRPENGHSRPLQLLFEAVPEPQDCWQVCRRIQWFRLPLPFALNHVNCWLLGEPGDQVLVDTGVNTLATRSVWQQHFDNDKDNDNDNDNDRGLARAPQKLLVTHFHPDHMGLAGWFHAAGSQLLGSAEEIAMARLLCAIDDEEYGEYYARWYQANGLPHSRVEAVRGNANTYSKIVKQPPPEAAWTNLQEGQSIELGGDEYRVLIGRGHAPDMLMLYRAADHVLIAADQVLPSISPNVSVMPRLQDRNPLHSFLDTMQALYELPEDTLVLPSHGIPFRGLHRRLKALEEHHDQRLVEVLTACRQPTSAYELFSVLFRRVLDAQQTSFALGESLAHLHYLEHQGALERQNVGGVQRFAAC